MYRELQFVHQHHPMNFASNPDIHIPIQIKTAKNLYNVLFLMERLGQCIISLVVQAQFTAPLCKRAFYPIVNMPNLVM